MECEEMIRFFK